MNEISILIIDDCQTDRYLLKRQLKETKLAINIYEQDNGQKALKYFKDYKEKEKETKHSKGSPPNIVFLDVNMPYMDGYAFLENFSLLRANLPSNYSISSSVFLMFTSSERKKDKEKALSYDFVKDYLVKGQFTAEQLKEKIELLTRSS